MHVDSVVCFVDDGSRDRTWSLIEGLVASGTRVRGVKLSRNRGYQQALLAVPSAGDAASRRTGTTAKSANKSAKASDAGAKK